MEKVVWAEGVLLGQQHFQQWDRYWQYQLNSRINGIAAFGWGLMRLEIDEHALLNGRFCINVCRAIFANGYLVDYDAARDGFSLECDIKTNNLSEGEIFLGIPNGCYISGIAGYDESDQLALRKVCFRNVYDLYDAARQREVMFARLNLQLLQGSDALNNFSVLKIAEVVGDGQNQFRQVATFIPALLQISGSRRLEQIMQQIAEIIAAKVRMLIEQNNEEGRLTNILILQTLYSSHAYLQHLLMNRNQHPEKLFLLLSDLCSRLFVFNSEALSQLPAYQHAAPTVCFNELANKLSQLLAAINSPKASAVKLFRKSDSIYVANIDSGVLERVDLFLAVHFVANDSHWVDRFVCQIKVGSETAIEKLITSALSGVTVMHRQRLPNKLNIKAGYEYFYLEAHTDYWQEIVTEQRLAIFIPRAFDSAAIELVVLEK